MKPYKKLEKNGIEFNKEFSDHFINSIIEEIGIKDNSSTTYFLWGFPRDNPKIWYVVTGGFRKRVVKEVKPSLVCKYINQCLGSANDVYRKIEREKRKLYVEIEELKKEKNNILKSYCVSNEVLG